MCLCDNNNNSNKIHHNGECLTSHSCVYMYIHSANPRLCTCMNYSGLMLQLCPHTVPRGRHTITLENEFRGKWSALPSQNESLLDSVSIICVMTIRVNKSGGLLSALARDNSGRSIVPRSKTWVINKFILSAGSELLSKLQLLKRWSGLYSAIHPDFLHSCMFSAVLFDLERSFVWCYFLGSELTGISFCSNPKTPWSLFEATTLKWELPAEGFSASQCCYHLKRE